MEGMKQYPDKYFDLAIVDPPYGINIGKQGMGAGGGVAPHKNRSHAQIGGGGTSEEKRMRIGGCNLSTPKSTRLLMIATHQKPSISKNLNEWLKIQSYGGGTTSLII